MRIIIDCDPGNGVPGANVDDAVAITYAVREPSLDVAAIWTVFGNTPAPDGALAVTRLLDDLGRAGEIPVRVGSCRPLVGDAGHWRSVLDAPGRDPATRHLWTSPAPAAAPSEETPLAVLDGDLGANPADVTIVAIGPLTDLARLAARPGGALTRVAGIWLMGGALGFRDLVDTNFAVDPEAANTVLASPVPLTIVPLDVTRTTHLSPATWRRIRAADPGLADRVAVWLDPWMAYSRRTRPVNGMWLHDLVVPAALAHPEIVHRQTARVEVRPDGKLVRSAAGREVTLVTRVDNAALVDLWAGALS